MVKMACSALLDTLCSASTQGSCEACLQSHSLQNVEQKGFWVNRYIPINPRPHCSLLFGPWIHLSFVPTQCEVNTVLTCQQERNKNKGQPGFTLGQESKRWVSEKAKEKVTMLDRDTISPINMDAGIFLQEVIAMMVFVDINFNMYMVKANTSNSGTNNCYYH